jgi:hypothetical protein
MSTTTATAPQVIPALPAQVGPLQGTKVELFDCNGVGGQVWERQSDGSLLNPQSGLCLDDPGDATANGTRLQISACDGSPAERFSLS